MARDGCRRRSFVLALVAASFAACSKPASREHASTPDASLPSGPARQSNTDAPPAADAVGRPETRSSSAADPAKGQQRDPLPLRLWTRGSETRRTLHPAPNGPTIAGWLGERYGADDSLVVRALDGAGAPIRSEDLWYARQERGEGGWDEWIVDYGIWRGALRPDPRLVGTWSTSGMLGREMRLEADGRVIEHRVETNDVWQWGRVGDVVYIGPSWGDAVERIICTDRIHLVESDADGRATLRGWRRRR